MTKRLSPSPRDRQFQPVPETVAELKRKLRQRYGSRRLLERSLKVSLGGVALALGVGWLNLEQSLPDTRNLQAVTAQRRETLTLTSADGFIIYQSGPATRQRSRINQIPQTVKQAFLAIEDHRFYQHQGVDYQGIFRAIVQNLLAGNVVEGGSTITQQLARISYLDQRPTPIRKLREIRLAQKIEAELSKAEILERYLNQVYLGSGAYGVTDAAWVYFGKPLPRLTLAEAATLAGLPAAPSLYSPLLNPETAQERRNLVLQRMQAAGWISQNQMETAQAQPLQVRPHSPPNLKDHAPYFRTYIQRQLPQYVPKAVLQTGGLMVETTLNLKWQRLAERVVKDTVYLDGYYQRFDQGALVAVDPRKGEIKAMVGGFEFSQSQFNRVTQAQRQPGSTFKSFVYAAAIATGLSPQDGYLDAPFTVDGYQPKNYGKNHRGWISMREALTHSVNLVAVRALLEVGFDPVIKLAHQMGIRSELKPVYSMALGSNEVTLLELTSAYGCIAAQGVHVSPYGIRRIRDRQGQVIYDAKVQSKRVLDPQTAAIMTWMLRHVVTSGTGVAAQIGRPAAGKTGTSEKARDLWFIGFIPQLVTGVWLGNDDNYPTAGSSGTAAYVWHEFMRQAATDLPVQPFPPLPTLARRKGSIKAQPIRNANVRAVAAEAEGDDSAQEN